MVGIKTDVTSDSRFEKKRKKTQKTGVDILLSE